MSYLNPLRLHFAGRFQANVSTVNNDPGHFDNASFKPSYQDMQTRTAMNGWFNPQGDAAWRLLGVEVSSAWTAAGAVDASDPVLACIVADSDGRVPAKLVDLDPLDRCPADDGLLTLTPHCCQRQGNQQWECFSHSVDHTPS
jgi:hypothetical protein